MLKRLKNIWRLSGYDVIPIDSNTITLTKQGKEPQAQIISLTDPLDTIFNDTNGKEDTDRA